MMYLCRMLHLTEVRRGQNDLGIWCSGCKRNIPKTQTYKFQRIGNGWFLARESKDRVTKSVWDDPIYVRNYKKWYARKSRSTPDGYKKYRNSRKAYDDRRKAEKLGQQQT